MVIIRVSSSSENVMLNTVRRLRRLLRNALFVTKRVNVMRLRKAHQLTREFPERDSQSKFTLALRIRQRSRYGQLGRIFFSRFFVNMLFANDDGPDSLNVSIVMHDTGIGCAAVVGVMAMLQQLRSGPALRCGSWRSPHIKM